MISLTTFKSEFADFFVMVFKDLKQLNLNNKTKRYYFRRFRNLLVTAYLLCYPVINTAAIEDNKKIIGNNTNKALNSTKTNEVIQIDPGEYAILRIKKHLALPPNVYFGRQKTIITDDKTHWQIIVGVDKKTTSGKYIVTGVETDKSNFTIPFIVNPVFGDIHVTKKATKDLLGLVPIRIKKKINNTFSLPKELPWSNITPKFPLSYPSKDNWQENSKLIKDGLRLTLDKSTNVVSPSDAIILKIELNEINSKESNYAVWLDHGMGLYSYISGLPSVSIGEQDVIKQGSVLSYITSNKTKKTPLVNITWRVIMNRQLINPHKATEIIRK